MGDIEQFIYWNDRMGETYQFIYFMIGLLTLITTGLTAFLLWVYYRFKRGFVQLDQNVQKIVQFTNTDLLTGLPNRELFLKNLEVVLSKANSKQKKVALFFLDIDNFRKMKDSVGHTTGDALLRAVAQRLILLVGNKKKLLSRLGSDQFVIILENADNEKYVHSFIKKTLDLFSTPFSLNNHELTITVSLGISLYPKDAKNSEDLLKRSGVARYEAKKGLNNSHTFYTKDLDAKLTEQRTIELYLRKALSKNELSVLYQPKVDFHTRKIIGAEALLRWHNPKLGQVPPSQFIPLAEQTGLIHPIGNWILKEACLQTLKWHNQGFEDLTIAVNFSAHQLNSADFIGKIAQATVEIGLDPKWLELELTESLLMENVEKALLVFKMLKTMGVQVAIDDFGTGYSSLSHLKKFPADYLKIDQSFVKNIKDSMTESDDKTIVITIITMAKQLGIKLIAEGVETEEQFEFLKDSGCDLAQGYLFSPPVSVEDFTKLLLENNRQKE